MNKADFILKSKSIFCSTGEDPFSGSVVVSGNRIVDVVKEEESIDLEKYIGEHTEVYDFDDKTILPGFIDAHDHYFVGAISSSDHMCTEISESTSEENCVDIMKRFAQNHPDEKRLIGIGWFPAFWGDQPLPSKKSLDEAFPDKPVYLIAADVHTFWMNSLALEESGITTDMELENGEIGKYDNGEMNGLLFEPEAFIPAMAKVLDFDKEVMKKIHRDFLADISKYGITAISDMSADDYDEQSMAKYQIVKEMEQDGELIARMHFYTKLEGYEDFSVAKELQKEYFSEKLRLNGVKGFIDGVTSTYTAYMLAPYSDLPEEHGSGLPLISKEKLEKSILAANGAGLDVRLHCIGDGAVRMALDAYELSNEKNKGVSLINTIEHIESIDPLDIPRFGELGVVPSLQPEHLTLDQFEKIVRIGEERSQYEWPFQSILDAGGKLAFGSDYPVVGFNPFLSLYAAVYRKNPDGTESSVNPHEAISLKEALIAYTAGAANAYHRANDIGTLEKGKLADIAVADKDIFKCTGSELKDTTILMTMMDGKIVYKA